jgi:hypothetical protein
MYIKWHIKGRADSVGGWESVGVWGGCGGWGEVFVLGLRYLDVGPQVVLQPLLMALSHDVDHHPAGQP